MQEDTKEASWEHMILSNMKKGVSEHWKNQFHGETYLFDSENQSELYRSLPREPEAPPLPNNAFTAQETEELKELFGEDDVY